MENEEQLETGELDSQEDNTSENENDNVETLLAQKKHFRDKFEKEKQAKEQALKELEELKKKPKEEKNEKETTQNGLSAKDVIALRDVHDDDVDYLLDEAKLRGKTVAELKKDPYTKIILNARAEERKTAEASNTGKQGRGSKAPTPESVVSQAESGAEVDPEALANARHELRVQKKL